MYPSRATREAWKDYSNFLSSLLWCQQHYWKLVQLRFARLGLGRVGPARAVAVSDFLLTGPFDLLSVMQSYHEVLAAMCGAAALVGKFRPAAGLQPLFPAVNAEGRKLRLRGPDMGESNCLEILLEHACYLLRVQQNSIASQQRCCLLQETAWVTDTVVGQFLRAAAGAWIAMTDLAELDMAQLLQKVQCSGKEGVRVQMNSYKHPFAGLLLV